MAAEQETPLRAQPGGQGREVLAARMLHGVGL